MKSNNLPATVQDAEALEAESMDEMFGSNEVFDYKPQWIKAQKSLKFLFPDDTEHKAFSAVLLKAKKVRTYYPKDDASKIPTCQSVGGKYPVRPFKWEGMKITTCADCPLNQFGSDDAGKMCKEKVRILIWQPKDLYPYFMTIPTGSLRQWHEFMSKARNTGWKPLRNLVDFSLVSAKSGKGYDYAVTTLDFGKAIDQAQFIQATEFIKALGDKLEAESSEEEYLDHYGNGIPTEEIGDLDEMFVK